MFDPLEYTHFHVQPHAGPWTRCHQNSIPRYIDRGRADCVQTRPSFACTRWNSDHTCVRAWSFSIILQTAACTYADFFHALWWGVFKARVPISSENVLLICLRVHIDHERWKSNSTSHTLPEWRFLMPLSCEDYKLIWPTDPYPCLVRLRLRAQCCELCPAISAPNRKLHYKKTHASKFLLTIFKCHFHRF